MTRLERLSHSSIMILGAIALLGAMSLGQAVFAPVIFALVVGVVMSPLSRLVDRTGLPPSIAALSSLLIIMSFFGALLLFLEPVIDRATRSFPAVNAEVSEVVRDLREAVRGLEEVRDEAAQTIAGEEGAVADTSDQEAPDSETTLPTLEDALFLAPQILAQLVTFAGTLFFFMLTRREIYASLSTFLAREKYRETVEAKFHAAEQIVGRYFLTISMINAGYAGVVTLAMMALGMPSPLLWGIAAGLMNFLVYLGPAVMAIALLFGGLVAFDGWMSLAPAAVLVVINVFESQFVTPSLVSRAVRVNALVIFLGIVFFLWLWGPIGGMVAIPLVLWVNVVARDVGDIRSLERTEVSDPENPKEHLAA